MRVLVAGLGSIGRRHLANLRQLYPAARLAVLRSGIAGRETEPPAGADELFYSPEEVAAFRPQAAIIATPATLHTGLAMPLLDAGVHLFMEKPLAASRQGVTEMLALAAARKVTLMVGYNLVFTPAMTELAAALRSGRAGRVLAVQAEVGQYLPDWRPGTDYRRGASARQDLGGGALLELSHEIHYLTWLFGPVRKVQSTVCNTGLMDIAVEDLALLNLTFRSGLCAAVRLDFLQRSYHRACRITGSHGMLSWDAAHQTVAYQSPGAAEAQVIFRDENYDRNRAYLREIEHFFDCIHHGTEPVVDGAAAWHVLEIVEAAKESARMDRTISL